MKVKISDFSYIFLGVLKSRIQNFKNGTKYKIIEQKDFDDNGIVSRHKLGEILINDGIDDTLLLKEGDLIIKMFRPYTLAVVTKEHEGCIVPSNIAVIRQSKYPVYYLKECIKMISNEFNSIIAGSWSVKPLSIKILKESEINVFDSDKKINLLNDLLLLKQKRDKLYETKKELQNKLIKQIIGGIYE